MTKRKLPGGKIINTAQISSKEKIFKSYVFPYILILYIIKIKFYKIL